MKSAAPTALFRKLPSVDEVLRAPETVSLISIYGHTSVGYSVRAVLARLREEIATGELNEDDIALALSRLAVQLEDHLCRSFNYSLRSVINATGVILHTNLGRAPLADAALDHIRETASCYLNLEMDLATGARGMRDAHLDRLFQRLLDRETKSSDHAPVSTVVVNNNAAAVMLALNTLAEGAEVIVSRGELVEIGGSFRIPDVMAKSGAILREIGTTNRTRIADYEAAITERTRLLLRVHQSNFEIKGFTEQPSRAELAELANRRGIPLMEDLGSGALFDLRFIGIGSEAGVLDSLHSGVDIVTYSGDKLLGGPQAGLISGQYDLLAQMRSNSLFRALRVDKLILAALEATLMAYLREDHDSIPILRMMRLSRDDIKLRAAKLLNQINSSKMKIQIIDGESLIGGGAAPSSVVPTALLAITSANRRAEELCASLRQGDPPIIARVEENRVLLDLRTVFPEQDASLALALAGIAT